MALDGKGAERTDKYAHEGLVPPSEILRKPIEKDSSDSTISKGSSQNGIAPVKGSPLGRYNRIHERRMLCILLVYHVVNTLRVYDAATASLVAQLCNYSHAGLGHGCSHGWCLGWACSMRATTYSQWAT